ncbi:MAG: universal stress protein [Myxococcota bacterium]
MKRILVAVDESEQSRQATQLAADIARATGARLTVVHVAPAPPEWATEGRGEAWSEYHRSYERYAKQLVEELEEDFGEKVSTEGQVLHGSAAEAIADAASAADVDLVVVGSGGKGALTRALVGSVSNRLVHICQKPVLIVR